MNRRRVLTGLALALLATITGGWTTLATVFRTTRDAADEDNDCEATATTGRATARRRCDGTRTEAHVDNHITVRDPRSARRSMRTRSIACGHGEGRIKATGDKGARRELREKVHRGK